LASRAAFAGPATETREALRSITVEIGDIPVRLRPSQPGFDSILTTRYAGFLNPTARPASQLDVLLQPPPEPSDEDVHVSKAGFVWQIQRGDFLAEWDSRSRCGWVRQAPNPYSIDTVLRIVHTLLLADEGGFLLHASSVVRNGRAFLFTGVSGAGKTTISRLAPDDAVLLTDEISYARRMGGEYRAYGTPFAGELQKPGANISAPISAVYLLEKGPENKIEVIEPLAAARGLLRNILFFAQDDDLVNRVFESAVEFASRVCINRLIFAPDQRVWELIG
jgi:hypothetical protein